MMFACVVLLSKHKEVAAIVVLMIAAKVSSHTHNKEILIDLVLTQTAIATIVDFIQQ